MSEKNRIKLTQIKIRKTWKIRPVTKIKQSKKIYSRKREKLQLKKILQQEL